MSSAHSFHGRVALVTGGGSGIGRAVCQLLARDGARVVVTDINLKEAEETLKLISGSGQHLALQMDVTQKDVVAAVIAAVQEKLGALPSLLVNSAGIASLEPFVEVKEDRLSAIIDVNLKGQSVFTSLDLVSGYWQLPMALESREITAFSTPHGHYGWARMPLGLKGAPLTFQRTMNSIFGDTWEILFMCI